MRHNGLYCTNGMRCQRKECTEQMQMCRHSEVYRQDKNALFDENEALRAELAAIKKAFTDYGREFPDTLEHFDEDGVTLLQDKMTAYATMMMVFEELAAVHRQGERMRIALEKLRWGPCTCGTKTPDLQYHTETCRYRIIEEALADTIAMEEDFQQRVQPWMQACFGPEIAADKVERNYRFFEEATELVQSTGMTRSECHQLVEYVFDRPVGDPEQEVGGVMVTLAAHNLAHGLNMHLAGEKELARITEPAMMDKIRAKQAAKPKFSPLPETPNKEDL